MRHRYYRKDFHIAIFMFFFACSFVQSLVAQVTIGSGLVPEKGALLDLKQKHSDLGSSDLSTASAGLIFPRVALESLTSLRPIIDSTLYTTAEYKKDKQTHIGLIVYNIKKDVNQRLDFGTYQWDGGRWQRLIHEEYLKDALGFDDINDLRIPQPVVLQLESDISDFLVTANVGDIQNFKMKEIVNSVPNHVSLYNDGTSTIITFKPGLYIIRMVYEAEHTGECTLSSYFIDFPSEGSRLRIHTTAHHTAGGLSNHGGVIMAATKLTREHTWRIHIGRGQSGNCLGVGNLLKAESMLLYIERFNY